MIHISDYTLYKIYRVVMKKLTTRLLLLFFIPFLTLESATAFFNTDDTKQINARPINAERIEFAEVVKAAIEDLYKNEFGHKGKKLKISFDWNDSNINAYATRDEHDNPVINITGGMAGHPNLSVDGLALVICHELGHFLGGAPKKNRGRTTLKSWSSAEGQADYYATSYCIKKLFETFPASESAEKINFQFSEIAQQAQEICETSLCQRIALASYSLAYVYSLIKHYKQPLSLTNPTRNYVYQTNLGHPDPQCRLDTMLAGLKCQNSTDINFSSTDPTQNTCPDELFQRPRCWFYSP